MQSESTGKPEMAPNKGQVVGAFMWSIYKYKDCIYY